MINTCICDCSSTSELDEGLSIILNKSLSELDLPIKSFKASYRVMHVGSVMEVLSVAKGAQCARGHSGAIPTKVPIVEVAGCICGVEVHKTR